MRGLAYASGYNWQKIGTAPRMLMLPAFVGRCTIAPGRSALPCTRGIAGRLSAIQIVEGKGGLSMSAQRTGLCNKCRERVPAEYLYPDGQVWLRKECPECGMTESMVSSDAAEWQKRSEIWQGLPDQTAACKLNCDKCRGRHKPGILFMDVTNHCNMDCPICGFSLRGMGFDFNPPMAYFEKVIAAVAEMRPRPLLNLFGGEPTVRNDMFEIIELGRKHGVDTQITTNGLRLADEDYCKRLCELRIGLRLSFDGPHREIYEKLRNNSRAFDKKMQAMANLKKYTRRKHSIIACAAKGINDKYMADLIQTCFDNREMIEQLGVIPLYESWDEGVFEVSERTTAVDVEKMVQAAVPGGGVEFIPAGMTYWLKVMRPFFNDRATSGLLLFSGAHPNCEAVTFLIPNGNGYAGINHYLTKPLSEVAKEFGDLVKGIQPKLAKLDPKKTLQRWHGKLLCLSIILPWLLRTIKFRRVFGSNPVMGAIKSVLGPMAAPSHQAPAPAGPRRALICVWAILPFEEQALNRLGAN